MKTSPSHPRRVLARLLLLIVLLALALGARPSSHAAAGALPDAARQAIANSIARDLRSGPAGPATIDQPGGTKVVALDGAANDIFGDAVAFSPDGSLLVVGAGGVTYGNNQGQGAAYVFEKPALGWDALSGFSAKLSASDGGPANTFGQDVETDGNIIVVSAPSWGGYRGSLYVYAKPVSGWATTNAFSAKLVASDAIAFDELGFSLALDGDTIVAGAQNATVNGKSSQGSAYVFKKPLAGWSGTITESARLIASDGKASENFGSAVAVHGDTVMSGAVMTAVDGHIGQGAVYIYEKPLAGWSGTLTQAARITGTDGTLYHDSFGSRLAYDGSTLAVSAPSSSFGSDPAVYYQGAIYIYHKPIGGWVDTSSYAARLSVRDARSNDLLGMSLVMDGDSILAGAPFASFGSEFAGGGRGAVYVFYKPAGGWATTDLPDFRIIPADAVATDYYGIDIAVAGSQIVIGADWAKIGSNIMQGAIYLYPKPSPANIFLQFLPLAQR